MVERNSGISAAQAAFNVEAAARAASGDKDISQTVKEIRSVAISKETQEKAAEAQEKRK